MKSRILRNALRYGLAAAVLFSFLGCAGPNIIREQAVPGIPPGKYSHIIRLYNPEGEPERSLAGLVISTGSATVCSDYPREIIIKSLDELPLMEKKAFPYFNNYVIRDKDEIVGYVSLQIGYRTVIWRTAKDPACAYRAQIVLPDHVWLSGKHHDADQSGINW